ncbi:signal peptidase II [Corynebacterium sp. zg254]
MTSQPTARIATFSLPLMAGWIALDQLSKWWVVENLEPATAYPVLGDWFRLYLIRNSGAAFSFGTDLTPVLAILQLCAAVACIVLSFRIRTRFAIWPIALIGGGAAGNFIDRVFRAPGGLHGHVVDFFSFWDFAIFNVADVGITVGVALYMCYVIFIDPKREEPQP